LIGNVTGNVTGNVSGSSGSCTGNSATATTASSCTGNAATATQAYTTANTTDTLYLIGVTSASSGNQALQLDASTYVTNTGYLYATRVYNAVYNDYAECFDTCVSYANSKNRIVELKDNVATIASPESTAIIGIVSDSYGYILNGTEEDIISGYKLPIAMAGTVMVDAETLIKDTDMNCFVCAGVEGKARVIPKGEAYKYEGKIVGKVIDIDYNKNQYKIIICLR